MPDKPARRGSWLLICGAVLVITACLWWGLRAGADFGGTDNSATDAIDATGYVPWWQSWFKPGPAVESGLFALQAALGAGVLGYAIGWLRARSKFQKPEQ